MNPLLIRSLSVAAPVTAGQLTCKPARAGDQSMLVSITLPEMQSAESFSLELVNLAVLAICRIPSGWILRAENAIRPYGSADGEATYGAAALLNDYLSELQNLFLMTNVYPHQIDGVDYQITGTLYVSVRHLEGEPDTVTMPLTPSNFIFEPADRCPTPASGG
jgi:hypothetical protein